MTPDSEVAVRQNGHEHAVSAPGLDGQLYVDLDDDTGPSLTVPAGVDVAYADDEQLEADGGEAASKTDVAMRGAGIDEEVAVYGILASLLLVAVTGYMMAEGRVGTAFATGAGGLLLGYLTAPAYWSDRT